MIENLPDYFQNIYEAQLIMQTEGTEIDELTESIDEVLNQRFVDTSTWGLDEWEKEFGIKRDPSKPISQRRSVIKSKIRGVGTVTVQLIKNVAEAYDGGTVDVTEVPAEYKFVITFIDTRGTPPNLDDLKAAINEIKPAHLAVEYEFTYLRWEEFDTNPVTWDELDAQNLNWDEFEVWTP